MKKKAEITTVLYITAFVLWLAVALIRYTYFKDMLPTEIISRVFFCLAQALLFYKLVLEFQFSFRQIAGVFLLLLFMTIAWAGGRLQFSTMFLLIYCAKNVPFDKILKTAFLAQLVVFSMTIVASQTGFLEDVIWESGSRNRHGLGFTHCMLASHFGLYLSLIYIAIVGRMKWWRAVMILAGNWLLYKVTDGRTDMILAIAFVVLAYLIGNVSEKLKWEKVWGVFLAITPFLMYGISIVSAYMYNGDNPEMLKMNLFLNNRLRLASDAISAYGFSLFGEKITWVGASVTYYKPEAVYNYVDNSYLMMSFTYGVIFVVAYCAALGYVLYKKTIQKDTMTVVCLLVIMAFGMINPQSMYLTYNPFLLLLAMAWNPTTKRDVVI